MNLNSLRARVGTWYIGLLAAALLVFGAALYFAVESYLIVSLQHSLTNEAESIGSNFVGLEEEKGQAWMEQEIAEANASEQRGRFIRITRQDKVVLYRSGDTRELGLDASTLSPADFSRGRQPFHRETRGTAPLLIYSLLFTSHSGEQYLIEVGAVLTSINKTLVGLLKILLLITPLTLAAAGLGGHFLMSRPLRPLVALAEQAERIGTQGFGERLPVIATNDEMERLSLSLNRMINRLEEALSHNRRFSSDVSHELRTPLTILRGELEQVVQSPRLPIGVGEAIGSCLEEIDRLAKIVQDLLTIGGLDSGTHAIERQTVDLGPMAQWTIDQMHLLAEEKHITMVSTMTESALVYADSARVKQVLVNLLDNAIKYTPRDGEIRVSVTTAGAKAILEISDSGIGIPPESLPNVFDRFYRSDKARSRESGGTGLGLSIFQAICNAHEGCVAIQSTEGVGTTVRVELPLSGTPAPRNDISVTPNPPSIEETPSFLTEKRVRPPSPHRTKPYQAR